MTAARAPGMSDGVSDVIADLRERISALEGTSSRKAGCLAFGDPEIDAALPGGGLSYGALHEFAGGGAGTVDDAAAALFAAGIAARTKGPIVWCLTRPDLFFPALAQVGLHPDRVIFVESDKEEDVLATWRRGFPSVVWELSSASSCACRWLAPVVFSSPPSGPARWRSPCGAGAARPRPMILASRQPLRRGGVSASCRRKNCRYRVLGEPDGSSS